MPFQHRPRGRSAPLATGTPDAVTGFDETVPPGDDPAEDENAATPVSPEDEQPPGARPRHRGRGAAWPARPVCRLPVKLHYCPVDRDCRRVPGEPPWQLRLTTKSRVVVIALRRRDRTVDGRLGHDGRVHIDRPRWIRVEQRR